MGQLSVLSASLSQGANDVSPAPRVLIVGQGYVGLPLAIRAVELGFDVTGLDIDEPRIAMLRRGQSYIEDITAERLRAALASGRFTPSQDPSACSGFHFFVITVPTPLRESLPDLSFIESAARAIAPLVRVGSTVILESTTYPGTTEELLVPALEAGSGLSAGTDFFVGYSPERIDPSNPIWKLENTPKVVSGIDAESLERVTEFYTALVDEVVPVRSTRVAELTKLLENTFRHVNIALVNELAMFAFDLGVDVWEAIDAAATKPFGFMRFTPGPGVGGHCLPVDPSYLSWEVRRRLGLGFRFVELANDVNDHMPDYVVRRVGAILNRDRKPINGSRILVLGLAYKRNSGDIRESPALRVCSLLHGAGAQLRVADPYADADRSRWPLVAVTDEELSAADLVVLLTDHDAFDYERVGKVARSVLDTRNRIRRSDTVEVL